MKIVVTNRAVLDRWPDMNPVVWVSGERLAHIQEHHPDDYEWCVAFVNTAITSPWLVLEDHKNTRTAMFIGHTNTRDVNVIVKLAFVGDPSDRSFVVTLHPIGERSLQKLRRKNRTLYEMV